MDPEPAPKGIAASPVTLWLIEHVPGLDEPITFEPIAGGHSNLTFKVTDASGRRVVLRRPPLGHLLARAHDMAREHRIVAAVGLTSVPVPEALGLCEDESVNDAPFYVMDFVDGVVVVDADTVRDCVPQRERHRLGCSLIDTLADLHQVDPDAIGLGDLGRRNDYIARQLSRWSRQWDQSKTRELDAMERVRAYLEANVPEQVGATIVHGDYRLGNCLSADGGIVAVLDWELCTLGDPLADLGYLMNSWTSPGDAAVSREEAPTLAGGFPDRAELLDRYAARTGRDVALVEYYRAFSYWRLAAIVEGVLARYLAGQMADVGDTEAFRFQVDGLASAAVEAIDRLRS